MKDTVKFLSTALWGASLFTSFTYANVSSDAEVDSIEHYLVTGSRISRLDFEAANPVVVITSEDIEAKGFNTVYDALQSFAGANGDTRGQALGGSARNAENINLRGLGANRTLVLLNGKRAANYPRVIDGNYNIFNMASIPMEAVERIEIVTGASSSIYGSDAMAGVVNIITKRGVENTTVDARYSASEYGDGENKRFSVVTGQQLSKLDWTLALEYEHQGSLTGKDRHWLDDRFDTPADLESQHEFRTALPRALVVFQMPSGADDFTSLDPTEANCAQYDDLTYTSIQGLGYFCGRDDTGDGTLIHERENVSAYLTGTYAINANHTLSLDLLFWQSHANRSDSKSWTSEYLKADAFNLTDGDGIFFADNGTAYMLSRDFQREEMLDGKGMETQYDESMLNLALTLSGELFNGVNYEAYLSHSLAKDTQKSYQLKTEAASDYFVQYDADANSLHFDESLWWQPLSEEGFYTIFGRDKTSSDASVSAAGFTLTGELGAIGGRAIEFASFVEFESARYDLNEHPRTLQQEGEGWVGKTGTAGSGSRDRYAAGVEVNLPLTESLLASTSARYDRYLDDTNVDGALTYKVGLEWRPIEDVLVRGSHGTVFRAPDLHNIHKGVSGSEEFIGDYVLMDSCSAFEEGRFEDILIENFDSDSMAKTCDRSLDFTGFYSTFNESSGNKSLKEETGYSNTLGLVWSLNNQSSLAIDLFNIKLKNLVAPDSLFNMNLNEWQCLTGALDVSSETCEYTLSNIDRNQEKGYDSYKISKISTSFVNAAMMETTGFDVDLDWQFSLADIGAVGDIRLQSLYTHILETKTQGHASEPVDENFRDNYYNATFRSKMNNSIEWYVGDWSVSLVHTRYGSLPNDVSGGDYTQLERKRYKPLNLYNASVGWQVNPRHSVRLGVINMFDAKARNDASQQHYPYFKAWAYPQTSIIMGRQFSLSYRATL